MSTGAIEGHNLVTVYDIVKFPAGRYGLIIVSQSKGDATATSEMATEGVARIQIDESLYSFPFLEEDTSHDHVLAYFNKALKQHAENRKDE